MPVLGITPGLRGRTISAPYSDLRVQTKSLLVIPFFNFTTFCLHESHCLANLLVLKSFVLWGLTYFTEHGATEIRPHMPESFVFCRLHINLLCIYIIYYLSFLWIHR